MNTETENKKVHSREDVMKYLKDQLGVKRLQVELQELNAKYATAFLAERKAQMELAYISQRQQEAMVPHVVTEEDLKNNPEWVEQGINVGDTIGIPNQDFVKESAGTPEHNTPAANPTDPEDGTTVKTLITNHDN